MGLPKKKKSKKLKENRSKGKRKKKEVRGGEAGWGRVRAPGGLGCSSWACGERPHLWGLGGQF